MKWCFQKKLEELKTTIDDLKNNLSTKKLSAYDALQLLIKLTYEYCS